MSTDSSTPTEAATPDQSGGFQFTNLAGDHEIEAAYSWRYVDRIQFREGDTVRIEDTDGYYAEDEEFCCTCGEEFESEAAAKTHLREQAAQGPPVPTADAPTPISWQKEVTDECDGFVQLHLGRGRSTGKVVDGQEYLVAVSRATYTPPAGFRFDAWEPLESGRLTFPSGRPLFSARLLSRALATLVDGHRYTPERYTLYFLGGDGMLLEGPDSAVLVAPKQTSQ
ncbi:hypothetical protein ACFQL1_24200 [Halomicroarcula sp. GCM10025709]|uniref:hypothetical protein n=1 Tax=Haloarcula TaxID=2237 RepID=UPI0024C3B830|nr:hypothetical protein [Halomicroarcula sp. YJ-61-S]